MMGFDLKVLRSVYKTTNSKFPYIMAYKHLIPTFYEAEFEL